MPVRTINLTPDPKILRTLGNLELKGWQCTAELIDNAIDSMLKQKENTSKNSIIVEIPSPSRIRKNEPLLIKDNGSGMNPDQLESCLKAGYTSRDVDNLGLFGMGFNIATARLGDVVEVWSSTEDMNEDIGVKIDLLEMQIKKSFERELLTRTKTFFPSGTSIEISNYHGRAEKLLNKKNIIEELRKTYSESLYNEYGITLTVNNEEIEPYPFCTWSEERFVTYKGDNIPAVIHFEKDLGIKIFCERCLVFLDNSRSDISGQVLCPNCNLPDKTKDRNIVVKGWVGIQRYNDEEDYGINIIRNGRIIKKKDKSFFYWEDWYDKNNGQGFKEYPIEQTYAGGRIVGEVIADFITPSYTKNSFEETDSLWLNAVGVVRGIQPLQVEKAKKLGFNKNKSPLALLFYGYRRSSPPGKRYLIPGNSRGKARYEDAREWGRRFREGDLEYQDDSKWWEAVLEAELREDENDTDPTEIPTGDKPTTEVTEEEPRDLFPGKKVHIDNITYSLEKELNQQPYQLVIINYWPEIEFHQPIIFDSTKPSHFDVYINNNHALFRDFADGWQDLVMMEIAAKFYDKLDDVSAWPVNRIYYELKLKYSKDSMLNIDQLVNSSKSLMKDIQNNLCMGEIGYKLKPKPILEKDELKLLKQNFLKIENRNIPEPDKLLNTSCYLKYMDIKYIFKFIESYPQYIFDNMFFALPYENLDDKDIKQAQLKRFLGYLNDVKWFIYELSEYPDELIKKEKNMIIRNRFSLEYLNANRSF